MNRLVSFVLVGTLIAGAVACQDTEAPAEEPESSDSEIVGNILANTADVREDRLIFPKAVIDASLKKKITEYHANLAAGKKREEIENVILLGDREEHATDDSGKIRDGSKNPYGFIRRALSFHEEGDRIVIMTEVASLDDAFKELAEGKIIQVGASDTGGGVQPRIGIGGVLKKKIPVIDIDDQVLFGNENVGLKIDHATVTLDTVLDVGAEISFFKLKHAHAILDATVDSEIVVEASASASFTASPKKDVFEGHWPIGSLGPIPITLGLKTTIGCDLTANGKAGVSAGIHVSSSMKAGVTYERDKGIDGIGQAPTLDTRVIPPKLDLASSAGIKCYIRPQVAILFFDAVGPTVTPSVYGKLDATFPPLQASVKGGFAVDVGGRLTILGKDLGAIDKQVFSYEKELWHTP